MGAGEGEVEWPEAEKRVRIANCKCTETTDVRKCVDSGWTLSKNCPYVLQIPRDGGVWNLVEEKVVRFEDDTERARGGIPVGFDRSELVQGIVPHWAAIVISGRA